MTKPSFTGVVLTRITAGGNELIGRSCATVNEFIVIAESDTGTANAGPFSIRWCAIGDPSDWPIPATDDARAKQAGRQILNPDHGEVTAISGGDFYGYVFQERAITKMTYVGGDIVFAFDTFEEGRGCWQYNRRVQVDDTVFFESEFGYHSVSEGQVSDIGRGIVDDTYTPQVTLVGSSTSSIQQNVVANKAINCVFFESQNLCYNFKTGQWSRIPAYDGLSLVSIDSTAGIVGVAIGTATGGILYDHDGGVVQTATITTGETDLNQGGRAIIDGIKPIINGGTVSSRVGVRDAVSDAVTWCTGTSVNARSGKIHYRNASNPPEGHYQRAEFTIAGGFTTAQGADVDFEPTGEV